jgi:hypothetical protein
LVGKGIVYAGAASVLALHVTEGARGEEPFLKPMTGMSEWVFETLAVTGAEAVERNREVVDSNA